MMASAFSSWFEWWHLPLVGALVLVVRKAAAAAASSSSSLPGEAVLAVARRYLGANGGTVDAQKRGMWPDRWNAAAGVASGSNYCATGLRWFVLEALGTLPRWLSGSPSARVWMVEAQKAGRWLTAEEARRDPSRIRAGMFAVWDRGDGKPENAWRAHIALVDLLPNGNEWGSIDTNGPRSSSTGRPVTENDRTLSDPELYGFGRF